MAKAKPIGFREYLDELADPDEPLSIAHLYLLSDLNREDLAGLRAAWPSIETARRRQMLALLAEISEANFEVDFQAAAELGLTDEDAGVRLAAIEALWEPEDADLLAGFVRLLAEDEDSEVRAAAAGALGRFILLGELEKLTAPSLERAEETLFAVLADDDEAPQVQRRALESLGYSSDARMPALIEAAYRSGDPTTSASAVFAMGRSADQRWTSIVLSELDSELPLMRYEAARAAGELEARQAVPQLITLTADPDREVQEVAIWALGEIGGPSARRHLERLTRSDDDELSEAANEALESLLLMQVGPGLLFEFDEDGDESDELAAYLVTDGEDDEDDEDDDEELEGAELDGEELEDDEG